MSFALAFFILAFVWTIYICGMSISIAIMISGKGGKIRVGAPNTIILVGSLIAAFVCVYRGW